MTEAAISQLAKAEQSGYGKDQPLADYRNRLLNFKKNIYSPPVLFVGLSNSIKSLNHFLAKPCENLS